MADSDRLWFTFGLLPRTITDQYKSDQPFCYCHNLWSFTFVLFYCTKAVTESVYECVEEIQNVLHSNSKVKVMPYLPVLFFSKTNPTKLQVHIKPHVNSFIFYVLFIFQMPPHYCCLDQLWNHSLCQYDSGNHDMAAEYEHHLHICSNS